MHVLRAHDDRQGRASRHHDDGYVGSGAALRVANEVEQVLACPVRQIPVEDNQARRKLCQGPLGLRGRVGLDDGLDADFRKHLSNYAADGRWFSTRARERWETGDAA